MITLDTAVNVCKVTDMSNGQIPEGMFEVNLDDYRVVLKRMGENVAAASAALTLSRSNLKNSVRGAVGAGMSESEVSRITGIPRMTIRVWLGKK